MDTPLGSLDCWLYRVTDPESGVVTAFYFGKTLPGAPVRFTVMKDGATVELMEQIERATPAR